MSSNSTSPVSGWRAILQNEHSSLAELQTAIGEIRPLIRTRGDHRERPSGRRQSEKWYDEQERLDRAWLRDGIDLCAGEQEILARISKITGPEKADLKMVMVPMEPSTSLDERIFFIVRDGVKPESWREIIEISDNGVGMQCCYSANLDPRFSVEGSLEEMEVIASAILDPLDPSSMPRMIPFKRCGVAVWQDRVGFTSPKNAYFHGKLCWSVFHIESGRTLAQQIKTTAQQIRTHDTWHKAPDAVDLLDYGMTAADRQRAALAADLARGIACLGSIHEAAVAALRDVEDAEQRGDKAGAHQAHERLRASVSRLSRATDLLHTHKRRDDGSV